jgi:hypothetical protein
MSAATNYELNDAATFGLSFITSEEATLPDACPELFPNRYLSACVNYLFSSRRTSELSRAVVPNGWIMDS